MYRHKIPDPTKWRRVVSLGLTAATVEVLDELAKQDRDARGYGKPNRSTTAAAIFRDEMIRRRAEAAEEAEREANRAAAERKPPKPTAANRVPIDGQLELPIGRPARRPKRG